MYSFANPSDRQTDPAPQETVIESTLALSVLCTAICKAGGKPHGSGFAMRQAEFNRLLTVVESAIEDAHDLVTGDDILDYAQSLVADLVKDGSIKFIEP